MALPLPRRRVPRARRLAAVGTVVLAACSPDGLPTAPAPAAAPRATLAPDPAASDNAVLRWSGVLMAAIRAGRPAPTVAARAVAILHTAIYDAWAAYDAVAVGTRLGGTLRRPAAERTAANKERAIGYAAHRALVDLFPLQKASFDAAMAAAGYDPAAPGATGSPGDVGVRAAAAVLAMRHQDGANQANGYADNSGYVPSNTFDVVSNANAWQPLRVFDGTRWNDQRFATPHWSRVTPFALARGDELRPPPPPQYGSGAYVAQMEDVLQISAKLGDEEKVISEYWADGPASELPPGHWCVLAREVSRRDGNTLDEDAKLFFALGNAVLDASIAAWDAKRHYDSPRPITAIRHLKAGKPIRAWGGPGKGTVLMRGEAWMPYQAASFVTPPFPEYVSGHSTFSAASATVLARFTGSDAFGVSVTLPAGWSRLEPGVTPARPVTLRWRTFTEAADQAGVSRLYGGIHFAAGDLAGRAMGRAVGARVWARATTYFDGTAAP